MSDSQEARKKCPSCSLSVPASAKVCPECGDKIVHSSFADFVIILLIPLVIAYGIFGDNAGWIVWLILIAAFVFWLVRRAIKRRGTTAD